MLFVLSSFQKLDKEKLFKESITKVKEYVAKNDVTNLKKCFEPNAYKEFTTLYKTVAARKKALSNLNNKIDDIDGTTKMITSDGIQIQFVFKSNNWYITIWDVFSTD